MTVARLNDALRLPRIAHSPAHRPQGTLQRCITDELLRPHLFAQLLLVHHALTMCQQVLQHLEHLRAQGHSLPSTTQDNTLGIQLTIGEGVNHATAPTHSSNGRKGSWTDTALEVPEGNRPGAAYSSTVSEPWQCPLQPAMLRPLRSPRSLSAHGQTSPGRQRLSS